MKTNIYKHRTKINQNLERTVLFLRLFYKVYSWFANSRKLKTIESDWVSMKKKTLWRVNETVNLWILVFRFSKNSHRVRLFNSFLVGRLLRVTAAAHIQIDESGLTVYRESRRKLRSRITNGTGRAPYAVFAETFGKLSYLEQHLSSFCHHL